MASSQIKVTNGQWYAEWNVEDYAAWNVLADWTSQYMHTSTAHSGSVPIETPPNNGCASITVMGYNVNTHQWQQLTFDQTCP